jgi:hypothetical protein
MTEVQKLSTKPFKSYSSKEWAKILLDFDPTVNYTFWFIDYVEILNEASGIKNYTFVLYQNNNPIAIVPLYVERIDKNWQLSMGQEPIYAPIFCNNCKTADLSRYYEFLLDQINDIVEKYKCVLARFHHSPLLNSKSSIHCFTKFGYVEDILYPDWYIFKCKFSYVINLNNTQEFLFKKIRKGHKSNINQSQRYLELVILDKDSFSQELFNRYVNLYYQVKGDKRSSNAFKLDSMAVKTGFQTIMLCEYKNELVGSIALHTFNNKARYNSSVQVNNLSQWVYPTHFLLWSAVIYLKDRKFDLFEIGEQVVESDLYDVTKKEKNLSHFKAGWGGELIPWIKMQKDFINV